MHRILILFGAICEHMYDILYYIQFQNELHNSQKKMYGIGLALCGFTKTDGKISEASLYIHNCMAVCNTSINYC